MMARYQTAAQDFVWMLTGQATETQRLVVFGCYRRSLRFIKSLFGAMAGHIFCWHPILVDSIGEETVPTDRRRERHLFATRNIGGH